VIGTRVLPRRQPGHLPLGDADAAVVDDHPAQVAGQAVRFDAGFVVVEPAAALDRVRVQRGDPHAPA
jgi:hypothetical protein